MFLLFEEAGKFLAGRVLSEAESSAQVELDSGKRVKVKAANYLIKFEKPSPAQLLDTAQMISQTIELELAWEFAPQEEFGFADLAREYFSDKATLEQQAGTLVRLFESHGRLYGGPVEALRDVLQEAKDHETAMQTAVQAGVDALVGQLSPTNLADQFEQSRARTLAPGQDPRPKYWDHYPEFYRVTTQNRGEGPPLVYTEAFGGAYVAAREELRAGRRENGAN